jgi:hypothetical protein
MVLFGRVLLRDYLLHSGTSFCCFRCNNSSIAPVVPTGRKGSQFNLASLFEAAALSHGGTFEGCLLGN